MANDTNTQNSVRWRLYSAAVGVLLAAGVALNIVALLTTSWLQETNKGYATPLLAAFVADDSVDWYNATSTMDQATALYTGMHAGAFQLCYTLAALSTEKTLYYSYRTRRASSESSSSGEELNYVGIPSASGLVEFLPKFCSFQGRSIVIFQIGAAAAGTVGVVVWLWIVFSGPSHRISCVLLLASSIACLLTVVTYVTWHFAFNTGSVFRHGMSSHVTVAALVAFAFAAFLGFCFHPEQTAQPLSNTEPLV